MRFILCFLFCALSLSWAAVAANDSPPAPRQVGLSSGGPVGRVVEFGIFRQPGSRETQWKNDRATAPTIHEYETPMELVEKTARIPATLGINFMFNSEIRGLPEGSTEVDWVVTHPTITKPDGSTSTGYSYPRKLLTVQGLCLTQDGYRFDHDYELAEGEWSFAFVYQGKELVKQMFYVYRPQAR